MCGVIGYFDTRGDRPVDGVLLRKMTETLVHRGPDSDGYYLTQHVGLGFRRLSIVDLKAGHQPVSNEDGTVISVCNGEIFNYQELREQLRARGHVFRTNNDCEVLPHLYEEHGTDMLSHLNGQFAFVIFDKTRNLLFVARDHFGICPMYYTVVDGVYLFASEIKALLVHPLVKREVDLVALDQIFSLPGITSPRTLFRNISSLKPGHFLTVNSTGARISEYWDLSYPTVDEGYERHSEDYYVERLSELLDRSVRRRLKADVPVGVYLSGGLDSAISATLSAGATARQPLHSFSIRFSDKSICEGRYQKIMAEHISSFHHETTFDEGEILKRLPSVIWHSEQPLKETYNAASLALSEYVRSEGLRVVLTGEGSDELFAGYLGYKFDKLRKLRPSTQASRSGVEERAIRERFWGDGDLFYERDFGGFWKKLSSLYSPAVRRELDRENSWRTGELVNHDKLRGRDSIHQRSYLDFKLRMGDHLLTDHGDRMAMANSVEARYPFLDPDLVDFVTQIPPNLKLNDFTEKYILKQVARRIVPSEIIDREKFAFVAPGSPHLLSKEESLINHILDPERIRRQGYFIPAAVESLRKRYSQPGFDLNTSYEDDLLIVVITFGLCLEAFELPHLN
jgi:asparagine synthase (glutamine-hydrolysing)